jgi:hypothetical protein
MFWRGKNVSGEAQETELYSFGPMGIGICFRRPGFFVPRLENSTRVALTNQRIYGYPHGNGMISTKLLPFKDKSRFEVPYDAIIATEQLRFSFRKVLWIQYRDGEETKEISIMCSTFNNQHIQRTYELLQNARKNPP